MQKWFCSGVCVKISGMVVRPEIAIREQGCERVCGGLWAREENKSEDKGDEKSGEETEETAYVKYREGGRKSVGNQEARESEEDVDTRKATGKKAKMMKENERYGEGAKAVEV